MKIASFLRSILLIAPFLAGGLPAHAEGEWRASTAAERALDAAAFAGVDQVITHNLGDVQSVVVTLKGRVVYEYHRDGEPSRLRDQRSVAKSAVSVLVGIALGQGRLAGLDQPVVALMPEWAGLNKDPRAHAITLRHLLTMTAGFEVNDPSGTASSGRPQDTWARNLTSAPGERFAYDNALIPMLVALLEKATGMPLADYTRANLGGPLAFAEPGYRNGIQMRTVDIAKLGHLMLRHGEWNGRQLLPAAYAAAATQAQNRGGPPASMPYGYLWWVLPGDGPRRDFLASGWGGQAIWVHPPLAMVVAINSTPSAESQRRGQFLQLLRAQLLPAARRRG